MNSILRTAPQVRNRQRGQGMVEYIIIVALIALGSIAVYALFGDTLRAQVAGATQVLAGEENQGRETAKAKAGQTQSAIGRGLNNYEQGAR